MMEMMGRLGRKLLMMMTMMRLGRMMVAMSRRLRKKMKMTERK